MRLATRSTWLIGWLAVAGGCAPTAQRPSPRGGLVVLPTPTAVPRVVVFGGLSAFVERAERPSALAEFLYGPQPQDSIALRNPQGMARVGASVLTCDQGRFEVRAIELGTGRAGSWGDADHPPRCPVDVTTDGAGRVYVADTTLRAVLVYADDGKYVASLVPPTANRFRPCSVLARDGVVYVGDLASRQIARYDAVKGEWLPPWAPPRGERGFVAPTGLATTTDGTLLIADAVEAVVHRVSADGTWLEPIGRPGRGEGEFVRPKHVCCTPSGMIAVTDAGRQSVMVFDARGRFVVEVAQAGADGRGFSLPSGLLAMMPDAEPGLAARVKAASAEPVDDWVIVSDTMGGQPLTLLGIVASAREEGTDGP